MQDISNRLHIFPEENTKEGPVSIDDNSLASIKQIELKLAFLNAQVEGRAKKEKESTREPPMAPISESNSPMVTEETLRKGGPDGNPLMGHAQRLSVFNIRVPLGSEAADTPETKSPRAMDAKMARSASQVRRTRGPSAFASPNTAVTPMGGL